MVISLQVKIFVQLYSKYAKLCFYGRAWEAGILLIIFVAIYMAVFIDLHMIWNFRF